MLQFARGIELSDKIAQAELVEIDSCLGGRRDIFDSHRFHPGEAHRFAKGVAHSAGGINQPSKTGGFLLGSSRARADGAGTRKDADGESCGK